MQWAWRDPGHTGRGSLAPAPARPAHRALLPPLLALALLSAAWGAAPGAAWGAESPTAATAASPPQAPRAVRSTAQLADGGFDDGRWVAAGPAGAGAPVSLAVDPRRDEDVYLATEEGVYMTRDGGRTWALTALPGLVAFSPHPGEPGKLFAVTATQDGQLRIWRSEDRGFTWRPGAAADPTAVATPGHRPRPTRVDLALAPSDPGRLWLGLVSMPSPGSQGAPPVTRLWSSRDGGDSLQPLPLPGAGEPAAAAGPAILALAVLDDGTLFAATGTGLHRLPPGGEDWQRAGEGLSLSREIHRLSVGGEDRKVLYAAATSRPADGPAPSSQVYRSADGGARWSRFGIALPAGPVSDLVPAPLRRSEAMVAVAGAGVFTSRGDAWAEVTPSFPAADAPALLASAPGRRKILWAAAAGGDLYRLVPPPPGCVDAHDTLCLAGRFRVDVVPGRAGSPTGGANAVPLTQEGGWFWFRHPEEPEVVVRATAARPEPPGAPPVWTLYASSLTRWPFELRVHDTVSGRSESLRGGAGDGVGTLVATFPADGQGTGGDDLWFAALPEGGCGGDSIDLCLHQGRFEVAVDWQDTDGAAGAAVGDRLTDAAGWFRFIHPGEPELVVKIVDGRQVNGHWQIAFASLSDLGFELSVTDRRSGEAVVYEVSPGAPSSHQDPTAIPDAPGAASRPSSSRQPAGR